MPKKFDKGSKVEREEGVDSLSAENGKEADVAARVSRLVEMLFRSK